MMMSVNCLMIYFVMHIQTSHDIILDNFHSVILFEYILKIKVMTLNFDVLIHLLENSPMRRSRCFQRRLFLSKVLEYLVHTIVAYL